MQSPTAGMFKNLSRSQLALQRPEPLLKGLDVDVLAGLAFITSNGQVLHIYIGLGVVGIRWLSRVLFALNGSGGIIRLRDGRGP